ncbi:hypothetical protein ACOMHN_028700 [Nucella lapillus]
MKASRRKQTKPNRVPFGMDPATGAFNASSFPSAPPSGPPEEDLPHHNGGMEGEGAEGEAPLDMHVSIITCSMCPETFPCSSDLHEHMENVHGSVPKKSRMESSDFPTAYHRLGNELYQENSLMSNGHAEEQSEALSLTKPKPSQPELKDFELESSRFQNGEGRSVKSDGVKMFHPDAFCELCDKEFCNKYFLKTHRANKHGIYDNSSPSTPVSSDLPHTPTEPSLPLPPPPPPQKPELSPSPLQQQEQQQQQQQEQNQQPPKHYEQEPPQRQQEQPSPHQQQQSQPKKDSRPDSSPTSNSRKTESELATAEKVSRVLSAVMMSSQSENKSTSNSSGNSGSTPKDSSMEDYCEYCQKRFCNKYYLKKHKQDVHGIIPETGPTTTKRSRASSSLLDLPMSSSSMGSPLLLPQPMPSLAGMPGLPPGVMVVNPFMPQMTLIPTGNMHQPLLHHHQLHPPPHSPIMSQPLPLPGSLSGISPTTPTSQGSQMSPNRETFCNICKKEFNNGYILKIHKANRHGIHSDDIPLEAKMLGDMVESNGMIMPPRPPSKDMKHEGHRSSPPPLTSINQMVTCRLCDKDFSNAQAFKIHQITEHGRSMEAAIPDSYESSYPKFEVPISGSESLRRMSAEAQSAHGNGSNGPGGTTMFGNMVAAKLADRVVCEICNKDLCNKYFLKSHKLKMHGVNEDEVKPLPGERSQQHSPGIPCSKAQPLNMTLSPKPTPPGMHMPKLDLRDYPDPSAEFKAMEKYGSMKNFNEVPSFLSDTINNEYLRRTHPQPPFKGLDFSMPGLVPTSSANLSHDQLVEEGIDPEAYCDICKKEFCSKYFLRTHKKNIHGIKVEIPPPDRTRAKPGPKPALSKICSMNNHNGHPLAGLPMPGMPFNFPPAMMMGGIHGNGSNSFNFNCSRDSFEKHQFRWKDPSSNSQRVACEICNKEVCNKYFLRTHKLKKHGIPPSDTSLSPTSGSPIPSENDGSSNHSSQPDNFLMDKGTTMFSRPDGLSVPQSIPLPPSEKSTKSAEQPKMSRSEEEKAFLYKHNNNSSSINNNRDTESVTCGLCERRFKNNEWLSAHMRKDHAGLCSPSFMDLCALQPPLGHLGQFDAPMEPRFCHVCCKFMPNEITLQLHLMHEHNAQIRLEMDEAAGYRPPVITSAGSSRTVGLKAVKPWKSATRRQGLMAIRKQKMYVCSVCNYNTHWMSTLMAHEENVHGILANNKKPRFDMASFEDKTSVDSREKSVCLKQFKCGLCPSRFTTYQYCQTHLREAHVHMLKDFVTSRKRLRRGKKLFCPVCPFSTSFLFRLHSHVARFHRRKAVRHRQRKSVAAEDMVTSPSRLREMGEDPMRSSPSDGMGEESSFERPATPENMLKRAFHLAGERMDLLCH